jgi:dinuclear metal center YbgI/SA1388 family protein
MPDVTLSAVVRECDRVLRPAMFEDWDGACNGLQVENRGRVTRLASAVDASPATAELALAVGADLLLVHHGLFWTPRQPWTGSTYRLLQRLVTGNLAVYSAHLPLDAHPRLGNNALLCRALGLPRPRPFFECKGRPIGLRVSMRIVREELAGRLTRALAGPVKVIPGGPPVCRRIGIVTGGAGAEVRQAVAEGVDTFITGEGPHWTFALAEELGVNLFYGGHYATETLGVQALGAHLARKFSLPWRFLDHPSGL